MEFERGEVEEIRGEEYGTVEEQVLKFEENLFDCHLDLKRLLELLDDRLSVF